MRKIEGKKEQKTDTHGEDKKEKQHKLGMNIWNVIHIFRFETQTFTRMEYTLG